MPYIGQPSPELREELDHLWRFARRFATTPVYEPIQVPIGGEAEELNGSEEEEQSEEEEEPPKTRGCSDRNVRRVKKKLLDVLRETSSVEQQGLVLRSLAIR
jgi:hypothetical protein